MPGPPSSRSVTLAVRPVGSELPIFLSCPVVESASFKLISGPKTQTLIQLRLIIYFFMSSLCISNQPK